MISACLSRTYRPRFNAQLFKTIYINGTEFRPHDRAPCIYTSIALIAQSVRVLVLLKK